MYKEKVLNTNVYIFSFVLAIYFFLYPNVLFNYGILKILIKYPFLGLVFLITIYSAMKKRFTIKIEHFIFLILIMISLKYSSENFAELSYMWLLSIFFYSCHRPSHFTHSISHIVTLNVISRYFSYNDRIDSIF